MRRVLECVSSGVLLPDGPGLHDPCEKEPTDVSAVLSDQQREELTSSAQVFIKLINLADQKNAIYHFFYI